MGVQETPTFIIAQKRADQVSALFNSQFSRNNYDSTNNAIF